MTWRTCTTARLLQAGSVLQPAPPAGVHPQLGGECLRRLHCAWNVLGLCSVPATSCWTQRLPSILTAKNWVTPSEAEPRNASCTEEELRALCATWPSGLLATPGEHTCHHSPSSGSFCPHRERALWQPSELHSGLTQTRRLGFLWVKGPAARGRAPTWTHHTCSVSAPALCLFTSILQLLVAPHRNGSHSPKGLHAPATQ